MADKSCILVDKLPDSIICGNVSYPIKTDFRVWLNFGRMISEAAKNGNTGEAFMNALCAVMDFDKISSLSGNYKELFSALFKFYCGGNVPSKKEKRRNTKKTRAIYDFFEDADYIFASFFQIYGIDLSENHLHWHKFLALFKSLPEDCKFSKILSYRSCDTSKMKGEEKKFYSEMKEYYALPDNRSREEKDAEIYAEIAALI